MNNMVITPQQALLIAVQQNALNGAMILAIAHILKKKKNTQRNDGGYILCFN